MPPARSGKPVKLRLTKCPEFFQTPGQMGEQWVAKAQLPGPSPDKLSGLQPCGLWEIGSWQIGVSAPAPSRPPLQGMPNDLGCCLRAIVQVRTPWFVWRWDPMASWHLREGSQPDPGRDACVACS